MKRIHFLVWIVLLFLFGVLTEIPAQTIDPGDLDGDGVSNEEEAGPLGDNPAYDGNSDGLADWEQANVASFFDVNAHYVTIDVPETGVLRDVFPMTASDVPENTTFPCGLFHFIVEGLSDPNVTITLPEGISVNSYYMFGLTPDNTDAHWYEFMYDKKSKTGAEIKGDQIVLNFIDGERGDDDLDGTNQIVIGEGGPALASEDTSYQITASAGDGGTISPSGDISVQQGDSQTFSIDPDTDYDIRDVRINGDSVGPVDTYTFENVTSDQTIAAEFSLFEYQITASAGDGGTISPSGDIPVQRGDSLTFSIYPYTGYEIEDVLVNRDSVGPDDTYTFINVTSDQTIAAAFSRLEYRITASAGDGGAIAPSGEISVLYGGSNTFSINPDSGYAIEDVLVNEESVGQVESYTFSDVSTDQSIAAEFSRLEYQITASASDGGTIAPSGVISASHGDSLSFSIYPYADYEIENVRINGVSVGPVSAYTFKGITSDQTIGAFFTNIEPLVVNGDPDGDGIDDEEEAGPDGDDPAYDGNGDGLPDCEQANVASFYDVQDHYVSIDVAAPGVLKDVFPMTGADTPEDVEFPCGLFHFIVEGVVDPNVTITLPESVSANSYYKLGPTPDNTAEHWYEFMYDKTSRTGAVIDGNRIVLYFVDGERGDDDLDSGNQVVIDQGGPAVANEETSDTATDDSESEEEEGCFITSTLEGSGGWGLVVLAAIFLAGCIRKSTKGPV